MKLPRWKCHKEVEAFKILSITINEDGRGATLWGEETERAPATRVSLPYFTKHAPEVGGYYVRYDDGYESYSPAAAFEAGYTRLNLDAVDEVEESPSVPEAARQLRA